MFRIHAVGFVSLLGAVASAQTFFGPGLPATTHYGGAIFNVSNLSASDLTLTGRAHISAATTGDGVYRAYRKSGSYAGSESSLGAWTLWGETSVIGAGAGNWTTVDFGGDLTLGAGQTVALALFHVGGTGWDVGTGALGYRSGSAEFTDPTGVLKVSTGVAKAYGLATDPFASMTFNPRTWSGELEFATVPEPMTLAGLALGALALGRRRRK